MEASHNEADLALGLELVEVGVSEGLVLGEGWESVGWVALVLVLVEVEDLQMANHTCHPCTSFHYHIADQDCISSHIGGKECRIVHAHCVYQQGNRLDIQHRKMHTSFHK